MKLRTTLKIISFALLVSSTMIVLRYPMSKLMSGNGTDGYIISIIYEAFNSTEVKVAELGMYLLFAFHMHMLDFKFPDAKFGRFFRYDMVVALVNYFVITNEYENVTIGYLAKVLVELASCATTFMCGWSLSKTLKSHAMNTVGFSYLVLSLRHIIYLAILGIQFYILMDGPKSVGQFLTPTWTQIQWCLLMPILLFSRIMLFRGTIMQKVHKHHKNNSFDI